jgi:hypothetical protein
MRLWSLHPLYLDARGLVALWREALLARKVLLEQTRGYRRHPQLARFRAQPDPLAALDAYLEAVYAEATRRGYAFDRSKIGPHGAPERMPVTEGQLRYELEHLKAKLHVRAPEDYARLVDLVTPQVHPSFVVVAGDVEEWERVRHEPGAAHPPDG